MNRLFRARRLGWALTVLSWLALGLWPARGAQAQVGELTLGIHLNCPYGLGA